MKLCYLDETGNTGRNLLDPQQPYFILGGLVVPSTQWRQVVDGLKEVIREAARTIFPLVEASVKADPRVCRVCRSVFSILLRAGKSCRSLQKLAEDVVSSEEVQREGVDLKLGQVTRFALGDALTDPILRSIAGIYAILSTEDDRLLFLGFSEDIAEEMNRHASGRTSGTLEILFTRDAAHLALEVLPVERRALRTVYTTAKRFLEQEYGVPLPLNRDK